MVATEEFEAAVEAARLAIADDDYERVERASLQLVSLARRAKREGRSDGEGASDGSAGAAAGDSRSDPTDA